MNRWVFLLAQLLLIACCVRADDVGLDYDASDLDAWEHDFGDYPFRTFESSDLTPPAVALKVDTPACHDGLYTFFTPRGTAVNDSRGMVIVDDEGELVWMQEVRGQPYNLNVQDYQGTPHLTFWLGDDGIGGHGEGEYYMLNASYDVVAKIAALNGLRADLHTLSLTSDGTAIISVYQQYEKEEGALRLYIWDCVFQEIDLATNSLVFEWRASDHHSLSESFHKRSNMGEGMNNHSHWDWFHLNSVQKDELGNYLVSARYTHSLSYIDGSTGEVFWVLGGTRNMFSSDDHAYDFSSQHYAQFHSTDDFPDSKSSSTEEQPGMTTRLISLFDNRRDDRWDTRLTSRGLLLSVTYPTVPDPDNPSRYTARIVQEYLHPNELSAESQGSMQVVPSPNAGQEPTIVIGWGARSVYSSYSASGNLICDSHFGTEKAINTGTVQSYRALRYPWVGVPNTSPSAVYHPSRNSIFVSWNGATEVESWALQHSDASEAEDADWVYVSINQKDGFETEIAIGECVTRYLRVVALDAQDNVLAVSNAIELAFRSDFSCDEINNVFITSDGTAFYVGGITMTPVGLVMVAMSVTMFLILMFECWRFFKTWQKSRDYHYYRLEVDPYL